MGIAVPPWVSASSACKDWSVSAVDAGADAVCAVDAWGSGVVDSERDCSWN